jgi:hypothetical protein
MVRACKQQGETAMSLRIEQPQPPTVMSCLRCQLLGRRRLLCSRKDACSELPVVFPLGPVLLAGWLATVVAFVLNVK